MACRRQTFKVLRAKRAGSYFSDKIKSASNISLALFVTTTIFYNHYYFVIGKVNNPELIKKSRLKERAVLF